MLPDFIMSFILLSKTDIGLKLFPLIMLGMVTLTFRIWVALESLQYLDNHEPQSFDFCIECTLTDRPCHLYHPQVKIMILYEGTKQLSKWCVSKVFQYTFTRLGQKHYG